MNVIDNRNRKTKQLEIILTFERIIETPLTVKLSKFFVSSTTRRIKRGTPRVFFCEVVTKGPRLNEVSVPH